jgi:hypothetical protein
MSYCKEQYSCTYHPYQEMGHFPHPIKALYFSFLLSAITDFPVIILMVLLCKFLTTEYYIELYINKSHNM